MKFIASILCLFVLASADLSEIRKLYPDASTSRENANAFHEKLAAVADSDANKVLVAYKGASETLLSKYGNTIGKKTRHMKTGARLIDAAVAAERTPLDQRRLVERDRLIE